MKSKYNFTTYIKNGKTYYRFSKNINKKRIVIDSTDPKKLEAKVDEMLSRNAVIDNNITVAEWARIWLTTYKKGQVIEKSYKNYVGIVDKYVSPAIGLYRIGDIKNIHLQTILNESTFSKSFTGQIKNTLTGMFSEAVKNNIIQINPAIGLTVPRTATQTNRRSFTDAEISAILAVCENHYAWLFIYLMLYCGLRPQEAGALEWSDFNIKERTITINKAIESGTRAIKTTKTASGIRTVPIPEPLLKRLEKGNGRVLLNPTTKTPVSVDDLERWFRNVKREADIKLGATVYRNQITESKIVEPFNAYCLRHTYCTNLQKAGVPLNVAKYLMGHSDIRVTASIYTHQTQDQTENALKQINRFLKEKGGA